MGLLDTIAQQLDRLERERKEVPHRKAHYGGCWLGIPILFALMLLGNKHQRHWLNTASPLAVWAAFVVIAAVFVFATKSYQDRVPIKIQLVVDLVAWAVLGWMLVHFRVWG